MILSIESSCDDSSLALTRIEDSQLLYHIKISQDDAHNLYGGVVPEIASRLHAQRLPQIFASLKKFLNNDLSALKAIAVTTRPGLSVTLIEGLMMAKTLALSLSIPLICVNHLKGHIFSLFIYKKTKIDSPQPYLLQSTLPLGILLVSGGHTQILQMYDFEKILLIAQSLDDSFGESFDKIAKYLGLDYPGGPEIEKYAHLFSQTYPTTPPHNFPIPLLHKRDLCFSFSGLKNAVRLAIQSTQDKKNSHIILNEYVKGSICAGFQKAACEHIACKIKQYFQSDKGSEIKYFAIVGGASANTLLREKIKNLCDRYNKTLLLAPLEFCSDNAAMIGRIGVEHYKRGDFTPIHEAQITPKSLPIDFIGM